jgi:hypothetical protein
MAHSYMMQCWQQGIGERHESFAFNQSINQSIKAQDQQCPKPNTLWP